MEKTSGTHLEPPGRAEGRRLVSASSERNKGPILEVLKTVLPETGLVLEIGAGTGQHAAHFAPAFPGLAWQPTDPEPEALASIAAWAAAAGAPNLLSPVALDVMDERWPVAAAEAVISINMIHIAPWACCLGLIAGASRVLEPGGILFLYGPFKVGGRHTAPSNEEFDRSLKARDPAWGVRNLDDVAMEARDAGFQLAETVRMPANNLSVVFNRTA